MKNYEIYLYVYDNSVFGPITKTSKYPKCLVHVTCVLKINLTFWEYFRSNLCILDNILSNIGYIYFRFYLFHPISIIKIYFISYKVFFVIYSFIKRVFHAKANTSSDMIGYKWRPPSLSVLTPMIFNTGLTHLGSETSRFFVAK